MNKFKNLIQRYIFSDILPLEERMVNMIYAVGMASAVIATLTRIAMRSDVILILIMLAISFFIGLFMFVCNRYHLHRIASWIVLIMLCDLLFPAAFFFLGGADSGMAAFFVVGLAAIVILSGGKVRVALLFTNIIWIVACYVIAYRHPHLAAALTPLQQTLDNIQSFLVSGFFIGLVISFQSVIYKAEKLKVETAMHNLEIAKQTTTAMFEGNPHISVMFDDRFNIIDGNPAAIEFMGFSSKEEMLSDFTKLISKGIPEFQPNGQRSIPLLEHLGTVVEKGYTKFETEFNFHGDTRIMSVEMKRLPYGDSFTILGFLVDLTAIHKAGNDIIHRDKLLHAVNDAAAALLMPNRDGFEDALRDGMEKMARSVDVDRVYVWRNYMRNDKLCYRRDFEWLKDAAAPVNTLDAPYYIESIHEWEAMFSAGKSISGPIRSLSRIEQERLAPYAIQSILVIPIFLQDKFWGFVSFDDCHRERNFSEEEEGILRSGSLLLANAIMRNENDISLKKRFEQQAIMSDISQSFISKESMTTLINGALQKMGEFLGVTRALIVLPDEKNDKMRPAYIWRRSEDLSAVPDMAGLSELIKSDFPETPPSQGIIPTVYCSDIQTDKKYEILGIAGVKSFIWTPIYVDGKFWGLLSVEERFAARVWNESDAQLVAMVSSAISGAVARDVMDKERSNALEQAVNASKAKGDFLSNMSHEMRTPMNAIIGMTSIGKSASNIERKDYAFGKIQDASTHLLGVINDILDMSKIEANKLELSFAEFNFEKMLQKVVGVINFRVEEKRQNFTVHIDRRIPHSLISDDQRLAQVITNLLSNAVKFTPENGDIRLETKLEKEENDLCTILIKVTDTGIGISEEQQARLFSSFQQAESGTSRKFGGTGLGLVISKRIVEMMGGRIWIESELGKGATFAFAIQAHRGADEQRNSLLSPGVNWENIRVLTVDDAPDVLERFSEIASEAGFLCDVASNGEEALAIIEQNGSYDIYFIDWKMEGMDGIALSRRLKEICAGNSVVIMISSVEWSVIEDEALAAGVNSFLSKPLFPSSIVDCINKCLCVSSQLETESETPCETICLKGYRMLLVEDVDVNREIVQAMLEPTSLDIDCAENGKEAVKLYCEAPERYNMIFMDVQMPEMDGYEATRRIRAFEAQNSEQVPIVAMTANVFREDIEKCLESGMNDHVGKPLDFDDMLDKLRKYLLGGRPCDTTPGTDKTGGDYFDR
ncbi:MAG: response regulator [Synergistaceae bacterium]|jgi:PAS domain S-box-containing protein|nr:response regulator [Synergistaceae bacterium]